jgi:phosphatidylinositol alpha-1,6-mannosyltransferase
MTTLLISEIFPPRTGGSSRWFWEIYRRLPRPDFMIAAGEDPRQEVFDRTHDLRVVRLPLTLPSWGVCSLPGLRGYWRAVRPLLRLARAERVQRVHCGRCLPEGLMALALKHGRRIPYLCYVHGEEMNYASTSRELSWLMRRVLRGAEFVIANSRNTERLLRDEWRLPPAGIRLLHPGVDTERFVPAPRHPGLRDRLGWGDRPVLLTVGRLQKRKGHDQLIRALPQIRRAVPEVLYAIVGDGEERPFLEGLVGQEGLAGHVQFLGELQDEGLRECYQQCDLFVLPNRQVHKDIEGFGMVLLEAQACGKPVVAGASGGTAETMRIPETGRVVPCDGPDELAALVVELLADRERLARMGAAARQWVVERFDWSSLSRQALGLFQGGPAAQPPGRLVEAVRP